MIEKGKGKLGGKGYKNETVIGVLILFLLAWFIFQTVRLSIYKYFTIDEFQYAHAAWLISKGYVPFRDFFDHHFPLIYQLLAVPFVFLDNNPENIVYLRIMINIFIFCVIIAIYFINGRKDVLCGIITPLLLLSVLPFIIRATEIRPDIVAFAFFILAVSFLYIIDGNRLKGFLIGFFIIVALWGSQKVFYYGVAVFLAFLIDLCWNRVHGKGNYLLGSPRMVILGSLTALLPIFIYLTVTRSWSAWFFWCLKWAFIHQQEYRGFSWLKYFAPFWHDYWWLLPFALIGLVGSIRLIKKTKYPWANPDWVLIGVLITTFASYAIQTAPFSYSLIPFIVMLVIFAARGVVWALRECWEWRNDKKSGSLALYITLCGFLLIFLGSANWKIERLIKSGNANQKKILSEINKLTGLEDSIYDNSGGYVTRHHVYYYFFTDSLLRVKMKNYIASEVPRAILKSRCVMVLQDLRFPELPASLKNFIQEHFQPYNGDIRLWGQRYQVPPSHTVTKEFYAIKPGKYFIQPPSVLDEGELYIDGKKITETCFALAEGPRKVRYHGTAKDFFILWLPRDNQAYQPRFDLPARFSKLL
jgi:hypothetical protein